MSDNRYRTYADLTIEELEQAVMAKKQPPSDTGGIMGLVMGGPPKYGG